MLTLPRCIRTQITVPILVTAGLLFAASCRAEMLYELQFQDAKGHESLGNSGSVGGIATNIFDTTQPAGEFTSDTPGPASNTLAFALPAPDGVRGSTLELPDSADKLRLDTAGDTMTIALWVKRGANPQRPGGMVGNLASAQEGTGWAFAFSEGTRGFEEGQLTFTIGNISRSYVPKTDNAIIPSDRWTHVAVVYKGDSSTDFYVDGEFVGSAIPFPGPATINSLELRVGRFFQSSGPINGVVDNVQLFNTELTDEQIAALAAKR